MLGHNAVYHLIHLFQIISPPKILCQITVSLIIDILSKKPHLIDPEGKGHTLEMQKRKPAGSWVPEVFVEQSSSTNSEPPTPGPLQERVVILHSCLSYFYSGFL